MSVKLFILGLPGSGKSTIARSIVDYLNRPQSNGWNDQQWSAIRFNDYAILLDMFRQDTEGKRFKPAYPSGFDVLDLEVFDEALRAFEQKLDMYISSLKSDEKKLVIVEFSRNNYQLAFQQFSPTFLQDSYFIHLNAEVEICKQRVDKRRADLSYPEDNFPVSEYIFERYYHSDDGKYLAEILEQSFQIDRRKVLSIANNDSLELVIERITSFINSISDTVLSDKSNVRPSRH